MTTIRAALQNAKRRFEPVSSSASLDAHLLLCEALGVERWILLAHPERVLDDTQFERFEGLVERRAAGEPVAYILGDAPFMTVISP
jgi:release factor glutamine methyltransferase